MSKRVYLCVYAMSGAVSVSVGQLSYTNSWIGNSGGTPQTHVMHNIDNIFVRLDGTVYAVTGWDEGGSNVTVFKNGAITAVPENSGTGGWGRMSGTVVTADETYIYQALSQHGCDGGNAELNRNGLPQYPPCIAENPVVWNCIARYFHDGTLAPFVQGYGFKAAYLLVNMNGRLPNGLAVMNGELFVSDPTGDTVKVYATASLTTTPVRQFHVPRAGLLAADTLGFLWMLQRADETHDAQIIRFSAATGALQPQAISFPDDVVPTALCVDNQRARILVTDNGVNQNIRIYGSIFSTPSLTGTFGETGGIVSGIAGTVAPLKFINPMGVGVDAAGNIYVASTGFTKGSSRGSAVECYTAQGVRQWVQYGLVFTASADVDRANETDVYTFDRHYTIDYSKSTPGSEWTYQGYTIDPFRYPEDGRLQDIFTTSAMVRTIDGRKILYTSDMYGSMLGIYRFSPHTHGETAIPCGFFTAGKFGPGWPPGHQTGTEWFWLDKNGDGRFSADEYDNNTVDNNYAMAWWVDENGGVWKGLREQGARYFPLQGFNAQGAPLYGYASSHKYPLPTGTNGVKRICYRADKDELYLAGFSAARPDSEDTWWCMGSTLCQYKNWLNGNRQPTLTITIPFAKRYPSERYYAKAFTVEGDYIFVSMAHEGRILVYARTDGQYVGEILPTPATGSASGWTDINVAIQAYKRANGEYIILNEENGFGKVMMYRWCPEGSCGETAPQHAGGQSAALHAAISWDGNAQHCRFLTPQGRRIPARLLIDYAGIVYVVDADGHTVSRHTVLSAAGGRRLERLARTLHFRR